MLIRGLIYNRDINPQVYDTADKNMKQRTLLLDSNLNDEFQKQNKKLRKKLAAKNKVYQWIEWGKKQIINGSFFFYHNAKVQIYKIHQISLMFSSCLYSIFVVFFPMKYNIIL